MNKTKPTRFWEPNPMKVQGTSPLKRAVFLLLLLVTVMAGGCAPRPRPAAPAALVPERKAIAKMGYAIQAGAFAGAENAALLSRTLQERGLEATYFLSEGLYKVRFGNFPTRESARAKATEVQKAAIIAEFYIVSPEEYPLARSQGKGKAYLREELVRSARSFLGVPYLWGGLSREKGFDCSGLTMTVYQLNGLDLPRTSQEQFLAGDPVQLEAIEKGDLVFFASSKEPVSHVGLYAGDGQFIHAPERGKTIRIDSLWSGYYSRAYIGARSYL
jgi:cell wall-associated NlpC family hydrolase